MLSAVAITSSTAAGPFVTSMTTRAFPSTSGGTFDTVFGSSCAGVGGGGRFRTHAACPKQINITTAVARVVCIFVGLRTQETGRVSKSHTTRIFLTSGIQWGVFCRLSAGFFVILFSCALAPDALADSPSDQAVAQALFDQARELMQKKQYAEACGLLEKSEALDPGGGTLLNLAVCYEGKGALAQAYATYQEVLSEAHREKRSDRADTATHRIDALAPRLPHILIKLPDHANDPSLVMQLDDLIMGSALIGVATPVDPGPHHVRVSRMGDKPWTWDGTIAEGETRELAPELVPLDALPPPPPTPSTTAPIAQPSPLPPAPTQRQTTRIAAASWVLGGAAIAATAASVITGVLALNAQSSWKSQCIPDRSYCADPNAASSDESRAKAFAWTSTITATVAVGALVGAILWPKATVFEKVATGTFAITF